MTRIPVFTPEIALETKLKSDLPGIWADLLLKLNKIVAHLNLQKNKKISLAANLRLSDFAMFCSRLGDLSDVIDGETLKKGLSLLGSAQQQALANSQNAVYPMLRDWIESDPDAASDKFTSQQLWEILSQRVKHNGQKFFWKDGRALAKHIVAYKEFLNKELGLEIVSEYDSSKGRNRNYYVFHTAQAFSKMENNTLLN